MRHRWTVSECLLWFVLSLLLAAFFAHVISRMSVSPRELVSLVPVNTDPMDRYCRRWLDVVYSYNECQDFHSAFGRRQK